MITITFELGAWEVFWLLVAFSLGISVGSFLEGFIKGILKRSL